MSNYNPRKNACVITYPYHNLCFTITGYGNMSPTTPNGQLFFMFYAIFGIPLMLIFLARVGVRINELHQTLSDSMSCIKNPRLHRFLDTTVMFWLGISLFLLVPGGVFYYMEEWSYLTSCYFAVVTLSTVGFGDYVTGKTPPWISNHMLIKVWDDITFPLLNFTGATGDVWERIDDFIPHFLIYVITYPCWN